MHAHQAFVRRMPIKLVVAVLGRAMTKKARCAKSRSTWDPEAEVSRAQRAHACAFALLARRSPLLLAATPLPNTFQTPKNVKC